MDNAYNPASSKIIRALTEAEVMSIYFPWVGKAYIVDTRHNLENGPAVLLDDMAGSPEERLRSIQRLRPQFERIGQLTLAPWIGSTRSFAERGVLDAVVERFQTLGFPDTAQAARTTFRALRREERAMLLDLVAGNPRTTRTIWARPHD